MPNFPRQFTLASFRYDLWKLRTKGLVQKIPHSRRYGLAGKGYAVCLIFLKLFERVYAPLTAGLLKPFPGDRKVADEKRCTPDRLYGRILDDLNALLRRSDSRPPPEPETITKFSFGAP